MTQLTAKSVNGTKSPSNDSASYAVSGAMTRVEKLNSEAEARWADKLRVDNSLTRAMVSFQANKGKAVYRWFKYKEAFSAGLVEHLISKYRIAGVQFLFFMRQNRATLLSLTAIPGEIPCLEVAAKRSSLADVFEEKLDLRPLDTVLPRK